MADFEVGTLTPEQTRLLWLDYQERKQLQPHAQANFPNRRPIDEPSPHRVFVKNESGEDIPSWACMQVDGVVEHGGRTLVKVIKPDSICSEYLFNSQHEIKDGECGWAYAFGLVRMRGNASSFSACERYTPMVNGWGIEAGPGPFLVYGNDDLVGGCVIGRIIGEKCKAKWILFEYTADESNSTVTPVEFYDGQDPSECGSVEVEYPLGEPCVDALVMAFYDPNTDKYQAIATESAMLGPPTTCDVLVDGVNFDGCTLNYTRQQHKVFDCGEEKYEEAAPIQTVEIGVVRYVDLTESGLTIDISTISVCGTGPVSEYNIPITDCEPACVGSCEYTWNYVEQRWDLTTACSEGCYCSAPPSPPENAEDPSSNGVTASGTCGATDPANPPPPPACSDKFVILEWNVDLEEWIIIEGECDEGCVIPMPDPPDNPNLPNQTRIVTCEEMP
jgi:hypothetical protein